VVEVAFYHLTKWPLERALPRLVERVVDGAMKAVVRCGSQARLDAVNDLLWTYDANSFLPHGGPADGDAAAQPVYLTTLADNPNQATIVIVIDGDTPPDLDDFDRCLDIFDGSDGEALDAARTRWKALAEAGYPLTYWAQSDDGRWQQKQ